jgi:hypothetical protein
MKIRKDGHGMEETVGADTAYFIYTRQDQLRQ